MIKADKITQEKKPKETRFQSTDYREVTIHLNFFL